MMNWYLYLIVEGDSVQLVLRTWGHISQGFLVISVIGT